MKKLHLAVTTRAHQPLSYLGSLTISVGQRDWDFYIIQNDLWSRMVIQTLSFKEDTASFSLILSGSATLLQRDPAQVVSEGDEAQELDLRTGQFYQVNSTFSIGCFRSHLYLCYFRQVQPDSVAPLSSV